MEEMRVLSYLETKSHEPVSIVEAGRVMYEAKESAFGKLVFLSHSTADDRLVLGIIRFFQSFGAAVYVDDFDKRLPNQPDASTAKILKDEIKQCPRFVVLATPNSNTSRWIPWELGLADGFRGIPPNAIIPVTPEGDFQKWLRTEYYNLYPKIVNQNGKWIVVDPRSPNTWQLDVWLHGTIS